MPLGESDYLLRLADIYLWGCSILSVHFSITLFKNEDTVRDYLDQAGFLTINTEPDIHVGPSGIFKAMIIADYVSNGASGWLMHRSYSL